MFEPITTHEEFETRLKERLRRQYDQHRLEIDSFRASERAVRGVLEERLDRALTRLVDAEARALAAALGFINPEAAVRVAEAATDIAITAAGDVDLATIRARLEHLATESPYFLHHQPQGTA